MPLPCGKEAVTYYHIPTWRGHGPFAFTENLCRPELVVKLQCFPTILMIRLARRLVPIHITRPPPWSFGFGKAGSGPKNLFCFVFAQAPQMTLM